MMNGHLNAVRNHGRTLAWMLWSGFYGLGVAGLPGIVHSTDCGVTLKSGQVLYGPLLNCNVFPALTIEGPGSFDLNGRTISCALPGDGTLTGTGIRVTGSGARIHHGTIENCDRGMVIEGDGKHVLTRLAVTSPDVTDDVGNLYNDGIAFEVLSSHNRLVRNKVIKYAGEGFRLGSDNVSANKNVLSFNLVAESANHAFRVSSGQHNLFLANVARDNTGPKGGKVQGEGFRSQDRGNKFIANIATGNGDEGFRLRDVEATENLLIGNIARGNGLIPCALAAEDANPGIAITGGSSFNWVLNNTVDGNCLGIVVNTDSMGNWVAKNTALGNVLFGILVNFQSVGNWVTRNTALDNGLIDLADLNTNCDNNTWLNNEFDTRAVGLPVPGSFPPEFPEDPVCIQ